MFASNRNPKLTPVVDERAALAGDNAVAMALARWENEGGSAASDWKPRVTAPPKAERTLQPSTVFRLIKSAPIDRDAVATAFEALATKIQRRDGCDRVTALQRAVDENPERFAEYAGAVS